MSFFQVKISKKNLFSQIFMKSSIEPNSDMESSKIELIFPNFFISIFSFASISQNVLKGEPNFFPPIFMKITSYPNFDMENSKIENIFPYFFAFIFIFASISQKCPKKWVKTFFNRLSWKLPHNLILIWIIQKSNLFCQIFSSSFLP